MATLLTVSSGSARPHRWLSRPMASRFTVSPITNPESRLHSEITFPLLLFYRIPVGMVDQPAGALRQRAGFHLGDDRVQVGRVRFHRAGQRIAAQRAEAHAALLDPLAVAQHEALVVDHDPG